jgi:hypothetical protein
LSCLPAQGFAIYKVSVNYSSANILYQRANSKESVQGSFAVIAATQHQSEGEKLVIYHASPNQNRDHIVLLTGGITKIQTYGAQITNVAGLLRAEIMMELRLPPKAN